MFSFPRACRGNSYWREVILRGETLSELRTLFGERNERWYRTDLLYPPDDFEMLFEVAQYSLVNKKIA